MDDPLRIRQESLCGSILSLLNVLLQCLNIHGIHDVIKIITSVRCLDGLQERFRLGSKKPESTKFRNY